MQTMSNNRSKQEKFPDYAARFIGYSARIIARKGNAEYAHLDFLSGAAAIFANDGRLLVPKRLLLPSAVAELPLCIDELKSLLKSVTPDSDGTDVVLRRGEVEICVNRGADVECLVSQLASRYWAIEPVLEQAEKIGSGFNVCPTQTISTRSQKLVFVALFHTVTPFLSMENWCITLSGRRYC
jgi:hypothetical protein